MPRASALPFLAASILPGDFVRTLSFVPCGDWNGAKVRRPHLDVRVPRESSAFRSIPRETKRYPRREMNDRAVLRTLFESLPIQVGRERGPGFIDVLLRFVLVPEGPVRG